MSERVVVVVVVVNKPPVWNDASALLCSVQQVCTWTDCCDVECRLCLRVKNSLTMSDSLDRLEGIIRADSLDRLSKNWRFS